jgi:TIGR03009 family protein
MLLGGLVLAQSAPPPGVPASNGQLDVILANWEKAMTDMRSMAAILSRTTIDKVFQSSEVFEGTAKFVKGQQPGQGARASLDLKKKNQPEVFEKFICHGNLLYEYAPQTKVIRVHQLPPPREGQLADDNVLSLLFGMRAQEAKKRYKLTHVPANDKWYHYIRIEPILPADKADFTEARLTLFQRDSMPRQLWFQQPNGNEVTWDFQRIVANGPIDANEFDVNRLPAPDWRVQQMPRQPAARVIRQNQ